jgi:hypothetical protein
MTDIGARFWPGSSTGICGSRLVVVAGIPPGESISLDLLGVVAGGGGVEALLDVLFRDGFAAAPDFGIVAAADDGWRVVVRGTARLTLVDGTVVEGGGLFRDQNIPDADGASLSLGPTPSGVTIPAGGGLVPAVGWVLDGSTARARMPSTEPSVVETVSVEAPAAAPALPSPAPELRTEAPLADRPGSAGAAVVPVAPAAEADLGELDLAPYRDLFDPPEQLDDALAVEDVVPVRAPVVPEEAETEEPPEGQVAGAPPVEHPPAAIPATPPDRTARPAAKGFIDVVPFADDLPSARPADLTGVPETVEHPRVSVPAPVAGPPAPAPPAPQPVPAADAGRTVSRAEVLRQAAASQQTVIAKRCPDGHLTQAHVPTCRVCRKAVPAQDVITVPRPVLGRLVLPTGQAYPLDRPVVLGREPAVPVGHRGEAPHLVAIVDPRSEVSGQHALVSVDYWSVEVTDLGSTNGTEVVNPDGRRQKLVPKTPVELEPGARLVLAEILDIRFEAVP